PIPQPQTLGTTFKARVRDYMTAHTKRIKRFKNAIFKQREEINGRMTEMFGLLKELTTSKTPKKVLIREEAKFPVTKNLNSISLIKGEERGSNRTKVTPDNVEKPTETETETPVMKVEKINEVENGAKHQRRVNPKIHEVIKKEVLKLLDAGLIYPISDSPWVSPVHCVPKKGGFTFVENDENELIPTRLVTG
ncbi:hypothetical protein Tco_1359357, partial [Tanacetum coccineum]